MFIIMDVEGSDEEDYHFSFKNTQQVNQANTSSRRDKRTNRDDADYSSVSEEDEEEGRKKSDPSKLPSPIPLLNSPPSSGAYSKYANRSAYTILNVDDEGKKKMSNLTKLQLHSSKMKSRSESLSSRNSGGVISQKESTLKKEKSHEIIETQKTEKISANNPPISSANNSVLHSSSAVSAQTGNPTMNKSSSGGLFWSGRSNSSFNSVVPDTSPVIQPNTNSVNNGNRTRSATSQEDLNTVENVNTNYRAFSERASSRRIIGSESGTTEFCKRIQTTSYLNSIKFARGAEPKVLCASSDSTIHVYAVADGTLYPALEGHTDRVIALAVSNPYFTFEDDHSASNHSQNDDDGDDDSYGLKLKSKRKQVKKLKTLVASGSRDEMLKIWDLETSKCLHSIHAHSCPIWAVNICVRKDGSVVAVSGAADGSLRSWNGKTGKRLLNFKAHTEKILTAFIVNPISESPFLLSAGCDKKIRVWDLLTGKHVRMLEGHEDEVTAVTAGSFPGVTSLTPISNASDNNNNNNSSIGDLENGSSSNLTSAATNGVVIVSGSRDLTVRVWHFNTGYLLFELFGHSACVYGVSISRCLGKFSVTDGGVIAEPSLLPPGAPVIVSCGDDCTVRVWNLETGKLARTFKWHSVNVRALDSAVLFCSADKGDEEAGPYNPGVAMIASCGWDRTVRMHNLDEVLNEQESFCATCSLS